MIQNFVIPGFVAGATLPIRASSQTGVYSAVADAAVSPQNAAWGAFAQYPASFPLNTPSYVVLKGGVGAFPAAVGFSWSGVWEKATVLEGRIILIPVQFAASVTDFAINITDGNTQREILVSSLDTTPSVGAFSISAAWKNTLYSVGGQLVAIEGSGMNGVAQILDSEGHSLSFKKVSDEWLVLKTAAITTPGVITLTFKNAAGTTLGTTTVTVNGGSDLEVESFFWSSGDIVTVWSDIDNVLLYAVYGGSVYGGTIPAQRDLFDMLNQQQENFVRVVRDKLGKVIAYCPYTVMSVDGSVYFAGVADENGVISIIRSALPSRFIIQYDSVMVPARRECVNL